MTDSSLLRYNRANMNHQVTEVVLQLQKAFIAIRIIAIVILLICQKHGTRLMKLNSVQQDRWRGKRYIARKCFLHPKIRWQIMECTKLDKPKRMVITRASNFGVWLLHEGATWLGWLVTNWRIHTHMWIWLIVRWCP